MPHPASSAVSATARPAAVRANMRLIPILLSVKNSYAQGFAGAGVRMPGSKNCSHKNHCPVDGL